MYLRRSVPNVFVFNERKFLVEYRYSCVGGRFCFRCQVKGQVFRSRDVGGGKLGFGKLGRFLS